MARPKPRLCECGCGRTLDGRADQRYLNRTHKKRAERTRQSELIGGTKGTAPYRDTDRPSQRPLSERDDVPPTGLSRSTDPIAELRHAVNTALLVPGLLSQAERELLRQVRDQFKEAK